MHSNSYWLGEDVPCITYGLRGVIHATVSISNKRADLHSGVEGGAVSEPLIDLIHVLGKLVDNDKKVLIPGKALFYIGLIDRILKKKLCNKTRILR
jgi:di- and tripeptidase